MDVALSSIDNHTVFHSRLVSQVGAPGERQKVSVTLETSLDNINSIQVLGKKVGIAGAILGGAGGCVLGCGVPILLAMAFNADLFVITLLTAPIGILAGASSGYN